MDDRALNRLLDDIARTPGVVARFVGGPLDGIERVLEENGAARQCASFARGGMDSLLRELVDETAATGFPAARRG